MGPFEHFLQNVESEGMFLISAQVRREGRVACEWSRFPASPRFEVYSASKTVVGIGVGIAVDEGLVDLDERVMNAFPEESFDVTTQNASGVTVRDMLTMSSGIEPAMLWRDGDARKRERDWVRHVFRDGSFAQPPGSTFLYNNANSYILGCLIGKRSGQNLLEYLRYRLFEPLGIHNPEWASCPLGRTVAANGLCISVDEFGRLGQLIANGGEFGGKRLVSEAFVADMVTPRLSTSERVPGSGSPVGYGYHVWVDSSNEALFMWGIFGQYCIVFPRDNVIISVMSLQGDDGGSNGVYEESPLRERIWLDLVANLS